MTESVDKQQRLRRAIGPGRRSLNTNGVDPMASSESVFKVARAVALSITAKGEIALAARVLKRLALLALVLFAMLAVGCSGAVDPSGDRTPDAGQVDGSAGAASVPTPVDRTCGAGEQGYVSAFDLSLTGYDCTEVINRSGIPGGRSWCCPTGWNSADTSI